MADRDWTRRLFAVLVVAFAGLLVTSYATASVGGGTVRGDPSVERAFQTGETDSVVDPRPGITVVATDSTAFVSDEGSAPRQQAELVAFGSEGEIYYYNDSHTRYWDVDPVPGTDATVEYVYADHLSKEACGAETVCTRNGVERVNLTTGAVTDVYSRVTPGKHSTRWHDVDRVGEDRLLVADIARDRVYEVNVTSGLTTWEWDARTHFAPGSGGPYPEDWTHLNDVEVVTVDGREAVQVSLRNHDQVVYLNREGDLLGNWTLGTDDDHETLYEQHNPDFLPADRGGPAVLVADSENGKIREYQRTGSQWSQTWTWNDQRLTWPRDADRLPSGNTLVTDSHGDRVLEVAPNGSVVWSVDVGFPYEAERLGTGDESAGGRTAAELNLTNRSGAADGEAASALSTVAAAAPPSLVSAVAYLVPAWIGPLQGAAIVGLLVVVPAWLRHEWYRADVSLDIQAPADLLDR